jgi:beta-lactamase superfamily II metal-dependent hydrolase
MQILYADGTSYTSTQNPNKNSLVVRFTLGNRHALFMGDAPGGERAPPANPPAANSIEAKLLICCQQELFSDVLIAGHHGSSTSSRNALVSAVGASVYVISSGPFAYSGTTLPSPEIVTSLKGRGQLFETYTNDAQCRSSVAKIGSDNDGKPGGCDAVRIRISGQGQISANYNRTPD